MKLDTIEEVFQQNADLQRKLGPEIRPLRGLIPNSLGSSITLNPGDQNVAIFEARSKGIDAEDLNVVTGLTLNSGNGGAIGNNSVDVVGTVEWGIGGASFEADFDFVHGGSFSVAANYLRIKASYFATTIIPGQPDVQFQANAAVGYGNSPNKARRTVFLGTIAPLGFSLFLVPAFARRFGVLARCGGGFSPTTQPNLFMLLTDDANTDAFYRYVDNTNLAWQSERTYTIPNAAGLVMQVGNLDAVNPAKVTLVFELDL